MIFWENAVVIAGIYAIFTLGLQLNIGYTGLLNVGGSGFMAIGAYTMGLLIADVHLSPLIALPSAVVIAIIFGLIIGLPSVRLRGDYFAIATLAAAEVIQTVAQNLSGITGGSNGLYGFAGDWTKFQAWAMRLLGHIGLGKQFAIPLLVVVWLVFLIALLVLRYLAASPWGRTLRGIREDADLMESAGKNVLLYRMQSMALSSILAAVAGFLLAISTSVVDPTSFGLDFLFVALAILLMGGLGSYSGVVISTILLWGVLSATRLLGLPLSADRLSAMRLLIVGIVLIAFAMLRPQGIFGSRAEMTLRG